MKAMRAFVAVWLAAACCSAATADYRHSPSRLSFPPELAGLPLTKTDEFPNPALGIGLTYKADVVVLSIFVYTAGLPQIPDSQPELVAAEFEQTKRHVAAVPNWEDVRHLSDISLVLDGRPTRAAIFEFKQKGVPKRSYLYLLSINDHFVKVRYTFPLAQEAAGETLKARILGEVAAILQLH